MRLVHEICALSRIKPYQKCCCSIMKAAQRKGLFCKHCHKLIIDLKCNGCPRPACLELWSLLSHFIIVANLGVSQHCLTVISNNTVVAQLSMNVEPYDSAVTGVEGCPGGSQQLIILENKLRLGR